MVGHLQNIRLQVKGARGQPSTERCIEVAREERKKLSTLFPGYQTGQYDDEQSESDGKEVKKDVPNWKEQIQQDPYVGEAKNIIVDMNR